MLVSVFADASFCPNTHAGGWGAWVKSERGTSVSGAAFASQLVSATEAELCAAVNGVHHALTKGIAVTGDVILVTSDCMAVVRWIVPVVMHGRDPGSETQIQAASQLRGWAKRYGLRFVSKHVPGHAGPGTPRTWVNEWCDKRARRHMLEMRARIEGERRMEGRA